LLLYSNYTTKKDGLTGQDILVKKLLIYLLLIYFELQILSSFLKCHYEGDAVSETLLSELCIKISIVFLNVDISSGINYNNHIFKLRNNPIFLKGIHKHLPHIITKSS